MPLIGAFRSAWGEASGARVLRCELRPGGQIWRTECDVSCGIMNLHLRQSGFTLSNDMQFLQAGMKFLADSHDLNATIHRIVELAANACGSDMGTLCLVDRTEHVLKPFAVVGLPEAYINGCGRIGVGEQCCGRAALHRVPWVVEDMRTDPLFKAAAASAEKVGVRAAFSVPVLDARGECIAVLASHFHDRYRPSEYTLERAKLFAQLIAFALAKYNTQQALGVAAD